MIVRDQGEAYLLVTQPDHAWLSARLLAAVRTEQALDGPDRDVILLAAREHDNGWTEVDLAPTVEPATGRPRDFLSGSAQLKHELWLRGIGRAAGMDARAGALVAEHALSVHGYRRDDPEWRPFFESITALRDDLLDRTGMRTGASRDGFDAAYRCVRLADLLSLQFCGGWTDVHTVFGYCVALRGSTLIVSPDPFGGVTVPLQVPGRRIPARRYDHDGDLRTTIAATAPQEVAGNARGVGAVTVDLLGSADPPR